MGNLGNKAIVETKILTDRTNTVGEKLCEIIATSFSALSVLHPDMALDALNQLREQITPEYIEETKSKTEAYRGRLLKSLEESIG